MLQYAILHSHSGTIFTCGFWCTADMVGAASEVTNGNAADAVDAPQLLISLEPVGPVLC